jgi:hypothetical protein
MLDGRRLVEVLRAHVRGAYLGRLLCLYVRPAVGKRLQHDRGLLEHYGLLQGSFGVEFLVLVVVLRLVEDRL